MGYDVSCPYCGAGQEICHDDGQGYEESELHQQECSGCEKVFVFTTSISFYYSARKADCLNGGNHKMKPVRAFPLLWRDWARCTDCGEERAGEPIPFEEAMKA